MNVKDYYNVSETASVVGAYANEFSTEMSVSSTDIVTFGNATAIQAIQFKLYDLLIPSIGALAFLMNLGVVISSGLILKKGQDPRSTYLLLGNVAMTDLVTAFSVVFGQLYPKEHREHYICALQIGMIVSSTMASVFSVGLIAIDRYLYILHGLLYQKYMNAKRARIAIAISWIIGCLIGYLPMLGWYGDTNNGKVCWFIRLAPKELILLTVSLGAVPLLTVVFLYTIILYRAIANIARLQKAPTERNDTGLRVNLGKSTEELNSTKKPSLFKKMFMRQPSSKVPNKWRAIKVVLFTSGSFVLTWGPYFVVSVLYVYCDEAVTCKNLSVLIASPLAILGFLNTLLNPIIYAWWHKGFRSFIRRRWSAVRRNQSVSKSSATTSSTPVRKISSGSESGAGVKLNKIATEPRGEIERHI